MDTTTIPPATLAARLRVLANLVEADQLRAVDARVSIEVDTLAALARWADALGVTDVHLSRNSRGARHIDAVLYPHDVEQVNHITCTVPRIDGLIVPTRSYKRPGRLDFFSLKVPVDRVRTAGGCGGCGKSSANCRCGLAGELAAAGTRVTR